MPPDKKAHMRPSGRGDGMPVLTHPPKAERLLRPRPNPEAKAEGYYAKMQRMYPELMASLSKM